jgi:hypothetical protein
MRTLGINFVALATESPNVNYKGRLKVICSGLLIIMLVLNCTSDLPSHDYLQTPPIHEVLLEAN